MEKRTFFTICGMLESEIQKQDTGWRSVVPVDVRLGVTLYKLFKNTDYLDLVDKFGIRESTAHEIVMDTTVAIVKCLRYKIHFPSTAKEEPDCLMLLGRSTTRLDGKSYYDRKQRYSVILQGEQDCSKGAADITRAPNLTPSKAAFHLHHHLAWIVIEQAFELLKMKFRCLDQKQRIQPKYLPNIIKSCCILHNFLIDVGETVLRAEIQAWRKEVKRLKDQDLFVDYGDCEQARGALHSPEDAKEDWQKYNVEESCCRRSTRGHGRELLQEECWREEICCIGGNMSINRKQGAFYLLLIVEYHSDRRSLSFFSMQWQQYNQVAVVIDTKVTNHPRNHLMEAATLNSSRTGRQALSHGQPLLLTWECAHYRGNPLRKYSVGQTVRAKILSKRKTSRKHRNAATLDLSLRPSELAGNDAACSVITFEAVTIEQSVIRYVQEVKDNWAWLVILKAAFLYWTRLTIPRSLNVLKSALNQFIYRGTVRKVLDLKRPGRGKMGLELSGFVKNVTEKGCFVVLAPSLEARIQLKNLSNSFVQNPAEMFPPGKVISGRILSIEPLSGHIEMSLAATTSQDSSGWKKFGAGEIVSGRIHNIEAFGIFISLAESNVFLVCAPGCLCHFSEVSYDFIQDLSTLYKVGQWVQVKILKVDAETKRISLGMKASYLTPEDGIEPMEEEAINEEPSNTNVLMDNDEREEEDYLDLASKRFPQLCMEAAAKEKLLQKDQPPETKDDFERLVAASPNSSYM
ncbi:hypothetical protein SELMODRAFT_431529 [Selaginella moellendorffii]|uniref:S1 motif domain-containing protein n=1 Tax=Selaginella moellendorffii TaxID=88036 RepID=D8TCY7_SELML|nr:hypothetical protein SELMODRAFT_431529 [Selaginella moellendorffii]